MQPKISLKWTLLLAGVVGIALSLIIIFFPMVAPLTNSRTSRQLVDSMSAASVQGVALQTQTTPGLPIRLKIPKIGVDAAIEYAGLTPQGAMDVPKGPADVAWFDLGPRPGATGSAVIAGHYGWKNNIPAAFDNLSKLRKGDKVYVTDKNGTTTVFVVSELRMFGENDDASSVFGSSDEKTHLNLITCEGTWNKARKSYSNRLIVFTDKEIN